MIRITPATALPPVSRHKAPRFAGPSFHQAPPTQLAVVEPALLYCLDESLRSRLQRRLEGDFKADPGMEFTVESEPRKFQVTLVKNTEKNQRAFHIEDPLKTGYLVRVKEDFGPVDLYTTVIFDDQCRFHACHLQRAISPMAQAMGQDRDRFNSQAALRIDETLKIYTSSRK